MRRALLPALAVATLIGVVSLGNAGLAESRGTDRTVGASATRPNIVLVLMDDFSVELLRTMPQASRMRSEGAWYRNSFVVDSLCCPSRTALLTGRPPHLTGVVSNIALDDARPAGGYAGFRYHHNAQKAFNVQLQDHGYRTGFVGKFLNGYEARSRDGRLVPPPRVPGWSSFEAILGGGYRGWGFRSASLVNGEMRLRWHHRPSRRASDAVKDDAYATNVIARKAVDFIREHRDDADPYFLQVATYGPHAALGRAYEDDPLFPPAFRDRPGHGRAGGNCGAVRCSALTLRDLDGYDDPRRDNAPTYLRRGRTRPAPAWRTNPITLTDRNALRMYRNRARMVQSIDRLLGRLRAEVGPDTYLVLTSDNGFHLGQHQLNGGKGTPYDSDTRVPLVVTGPDVVPGTRDQFVSNIDLAPTFEELAGVPQPDFRAGRSFAESLRAPAATGSRFTFFEHTSPKVGPGEVDADRGTGGMLEIIPSYVAVRSEDGLLVRLDLDDSWSGHRYAWELYRYDVPWEDRNVFARDHDEPWARELRRRLSRWVGCTPAECREVVR